MENVVDANVVDAGGVVSPLTDWHPSHGNHSIAITREIKRCFSAPDHGECLSQNKTFGSSLSDSNGSSNSSSKNGLLNSLSNVSHYFEIRVDKSIVETITMKKNSKKSKNRGKHRKKLTDDTCVELGTRSEDKLSCKSPVDAVETRSETSTDPNCIHDCNNGDVSCSEIPKTNSPFVDYMYSLDDLLSSSIQNCTSEYPLDCGECRMARSHCRVSSGGEDCCHQTSGDDESAIFSNNCEGMDSVSVSWNGDSGTDVDVLSMKSGVVISPEQCSCCSDFTLPQMNRVSSVIIYTGHVEATCNQPCNISSTSTVQSKTPEKKGKQFKKAPRNFSACRTGNAEIQSRHLKKENNHSVWQRVQKNDGVGGIDELNKGNTKIVVNSGHGFASARQSGHVGSVISKTEGKVMPKTKASRKLKRKNIPGSRGEAGCYTRKASYAVKTGSSDTVNDVNLSQTPMSLAEIIQEGDCVGAPTISEGTSLCVDTDDFNSSDFLEVKTTTDSACLCVDADDSYPINQVSTETWRQENGRFSALPEWRPVGVKEPTPAYSGISQNSSLCEVDELGISGCDIDSGKDLVSASSSVPSSSQPSKYDDDIVVRLKNQVSIRHDGKPDEENDACKLSKILIKESIDDVCHIQMASEAVSLKSGSPIAEFERFLYQAAPVVVPSFKPPSCVDCVKESDVGTSLCGHTSPNISLGSLWKWYEKHGSYGLEVRTDGCEKFTRFGVDCHDHRAYFVPSLSAIQIFGCENHDINCIVNNTSGRTNWSQVPYLIFEYFEFQQPPQRRHLFERIKELVLGDVQCPYGDPTCLNSLHLHDLHPISWYAVAWYPIYTIPDGNFRTAFLTYHSLCNFARRNTTSDPTESHMASPVVGLQTYNAQAEGWFRVKQTSNESGSGIVESRVRSLEKAASLISTATVRKGSTISTNKHPDYEFFRSRRS